MLRFEGDQDIPQAQAEVYARLTDPRFLVQCIPDVESISQAEADRASLVLRPGFAFVRGTLDVTLQVVEAVAPTSARLRVHSKGIGSSADVEAMLNLASQGSGTRVHWVAEVKELGGLLKMVPAGLIRGAAQKVIADAWAAVAARLAVPSRP
jgi:carbon monoxide dehydrogenase subunit G